MNDIDFIKKGCDFAEGFEIIGICICFIVGENCKHFPIRDIYWISDWKNAYYFLFLQSAIDGIMETMLISIDIKYSLGYGWNYTIKTSGAIINSKEYYVTPWLAKRAALEYVFNNK